jgi:hypothetical protein
MRRTSSKVSAAVLVVILSTAVLSVPVFGMEREGPRRDDPIVKIIKRLLKKFGIVPDEELGVPKP